MRSISLASALAVAIGFLSLGAASAKTIRECDAEYAANKAAIQGTQKKADFVAACRAGTEVIPGAAPAAPALAPAAPARTGFFGRKKAVAPSAATVPTTAGASAGANQFQAETQARARCPAATVVWVNIKSGVYHFAGSRNYGHTKSGAYMCETDATAAGHRASKDEKHP